ncbi:MULTISPECIES: hypothetical protein [Burkholderia]|uniref:hypothetical protein n=1 Tax=Burkholderia TaxID=32008 RepID=UPI00158A956B|nr:hypothetical protein [Burkholderia ambifaria]
MKQARCFLLIGRRHAGGVASMGDPYRRALREAETSTSVNERCWMKTPDALNPRIGKPGVSPERTLFPSNSTKITNKKRNGSFH